MVLSNMQLLKDKTNSVLQYGQVRVRIIFLDECDKLLNTKHPNKIHSDKSLFERKLSSTLRVILM